MKPKLVHIAECAQGVNRYLEMLLPKLEDEYTQIFICSYQYNVSEYAEIVDVVEQIDLKQSFSPLKMSTQVKQIRTLLKKHKPDIVYCHSSFAGGLGRLAAMGMNCKMVYNPHGWAFNIKSMGGKAFVYKILERFLAHKTDSIICISKAEFQSAIDNGIDNGKRLHIIENGINIKKVDDALPFNRKELGIPEDAFVVGMIGRLAPQKAPDTFIQSAKLINELIRNTYYIIVGSGKQEDEIRQYAQNNGINLLITGWTDQPFSYLKVFDVAVLLSRWEGFGLAIAEYMAAEKNFVATRIDAIPTIVEEGVDGELVNVDAPQEVAQKVYYYYTHPQEASAMRNRARKKVLERFDVNRVVQQHKELFENLFNR